ncbi:hypothetical protein [Longimicrobium terrae]|uniref:Tetratricopeptide repeat protein n=1 Tax=Longimicrobium terrae TaxID=1639882 RepID=A0A841H191_9BACT|nr:hypothetical protein [Longimicrobium terrae]MBB4637354.1 hypothetical protein [Longimicrobium terrae]MBB6071752.1 hypothetical protein [Longimicrobium terrae]NNC28513.1 hypothetical protein [Longimicrobium terrae]
MIAWLGAEDSAGLRAVSYTRETALRHARARDLDAAGEWLVQAREALAAAELSPRGRMLAETMHHAGEAYLAYCHGQWDAALRELDVALDVANRVSEEHGFPNAEGRRVHLSHIHLRARVASGVDAEGALRTAAALWNYLEGDADAWPLAQLGRPAPPLIPRLRALSLNEIVTELALLLAREPDMGGPAVELLAPHLAWPETEEDPFVYCRRWLQMRTALHAGDEAAFIRTASEFLERVDGPRPLLWFAALRDAHGFCAGLSDGRGAAAAAEIAALSPPTFRVPSVLALPATPEPSDAAHWA